MLKRINHWIELRSEQHRLEAMPDRLLRDIGIEREGIRQLLRHGRSVAPSVTRPLPLRFRSAVAAFVREMRSGQTTDYHGDRHAQAPGL